VQSIHALQFRQPLHFPALDIAYGYGQDSGVYVCRAVNELGEAVTTASVNVQSKENITFLSNGCF
jgi:hypothetical protein